MTTWACEHCRRQIAAEESMRGRAIRCPFCGSVQEVPRDASDAAPPPQSSIRRQPREVLAVEPVPDRIVIDTADLDTVDLPAPPPRRPPAMLDPHQRNRVHQAWLRREKLDAEDDAVGQTCPFCLTKLSPAVEAVICPACGTPHHAECWAENEGCCSYGCQLAPFRSSVAQPPPSAPVASGQMTTACLGCGAAVRPGDVYCTNCGRPVSGTPAIVPRPAPIGGQMYRMAGEALLFGLLSLVCGPLFLLFCPLAIYYGTKALQDLRRQPACRGQGAATAGIILGVLSAILWVVVGIVLLPSIMR